jgi:hypothetical protein
MSESKPASAKLVKLQHEILAAIRTEIDRLEVCVVAVESFSQSIPEYDPGFMGHRLTGRTPTAKD